MDGDSEKREIAFNLLDDGIVALVFNLVAATRATGEREPLQTVGADQDANFTIELSGSGRRDHGLEDFRLAVIAVQRARPGGNGKRWEAVVGTAAQLGRGVILERWCRESEYSTAGRFSTALQFADQGGVERRVLKLLDPTDPLEPVQWMGLGRCGLRRVWHFV